MVWGLADDKTVVLTMVAGHPSPAQVVFLLSLLYVMDDGRWRDTQE